MQIQKSNVDIIGQFHVCILYVYIYGLAAHHLGLWHFELPTVIVSMASQKGGMAASGPAGQ